MNKSEIKKQRILAQARIEFANYSFDKASINRIIKAIDMPRGTFYLSFKNKEDLYFEILKEFQLKGHERIIELSKKHNGDIRNTYIELLDIGLSNQDKLLKQLLINFNTNHYLEILPNKPEEVVLDKYLDFSAYNFCNEEEKLMFVRLLHVLYIHNLCLADKYYGDTRNKFKTQLDIILKGKK